MTRLSDALERARADTSEPSALEPSADRPAARTTEIPGTWHFEGNAPRTEVAPPPAIEPPDMSALEKTAVAPASPGLRYSFAVSAQPTLVLGDQPNHTLVEQYRHLAAALHHAQLRRGVRTVMITSAVEAEGKTTTATNLALTLSHSHQRNVLLIDADLRRPSIHSVFQIKNSTGLGDALKITSSSTPVPVQRVSSTLSVLTAGRPMTDPMSAIVSDMMKQFIEEAAEQFDWVVLDTPPVALLSDANLLGAMVDLTILVVSANTTSYQLARRAVDAIGHDRVLGVVLNKAQRRDMGADSGYYYKYSYGSNAPSRKRGFVRRLIGR